MWESIKLLSLNSPDDKLADCTSLHRPDSENFVCPGLDIGVNECFSENNSFIKFNVHDKAQDLP